MQYRTLYKYVVCYITDMEELPIFLIIFLTSLPGSWMVLLHKHAQTQNCFILPDYCLGRYLAGYTELFYLHSALLIHGRLSDVWRWFDGWLLKPVLWRLCRYCRLWSSTCWRSRSRSVCENSDRGNLRQCYRPVWRNCLNPAGVLESIVCSSHSVAVDFCSLLLLGLWCCAVYSPGRLKFVRSLVIASEFRSSNHGFDSWLGCYQVTTLVHSHVPLSPSCIIWYQSRCGDALWLGR